MRHSTKIQEAFSEAYVKAVAAAAHCFVEKRIHDEDGVDLTIIAPHITGTPSLAVQVKSNGQAKADSHAEYVSHQLERKHYEDLRGPKGNCDHILVVVLVPPKIEDWLDQSPQRLAVKRCGYWCSLAGAPALPQTQKSKTVKLPRSQVFSVIQLERLLLGGP